MEGAEGNYSDCSYWDHRYSNHQETFEWYTDYAGLQAFLKTVIPHPDSAQVLQLGCGTSNMAEAMLADGYKEVTNIDYSGPCIQIRMKKASKSKNISYRCLDARDMTDFPAGRFTHVIDKAMLDSVLCGDNAVTDVWQILKEVYRVLGPDGVYINISHGSPHSRLPLFKNIDLNWNVTPHVIPRNIPPDLCPGLPTASKPLFAFVCQKSG